MKDPRICLTLPFWRSALPSTLGAVFVLRDPMDVARSLEARDGIPVILGLAMWDRYIRSATAGLAGIPTLVVEYDAMLEDPSKASKAVSAFLEQMGIHPESGETEDAATRLDPKLRHQGDRRDEYDDLVTSQRNVLHSLTEYAGCACSVGPARALASAGLGRRCPAPSPGLRRGGTRTPLGQGIPCVPSCLVVLAVQGRRSDSPERSRYLRGAVSVTKPSEQQHVVIIGMHRSGTSAVADAVARLGLALPDETDLISLGPTTNAATGRAGGS